MTKSPLSPDESEDLQELLGDVGGWECSLATWEQIGKVLAGLRDAVARGVRDEALERIADLEMASPLRIRAEPGPEPVNPPPDEINHLVHDIESLVRDTAEGTNPHERGGPDADR